MGWTRHEGCSPAMSRARRTLRLTPSSRPQAFRARTKSLRSNYVSLTKAVAFGLSTSSFRPFCPASQMARRARAPDPAFRWKGPIATMFLTGRKRVFELVLLAASPLVTGLGRARDAVKDCGNDERPLEKLKWRRGWLQEDERPPPVAHGRQRTLAHVSHACSRPSVRPRRRIASRSRLRSGSAIG